MTSQPQLHCYFSSTFIWYFISFWSSGESSLFGQNCRVFHRVFHISTKILNIFPLKLQLRYDSKQMSLNHLWLILCCVTLPCRGWVPFIWLFQRTMQLTIPSARWLSLVLANFEVPFGQTCLTVIELLKLAVYYSVNTSISEFHPPHMNCRHLPHLVIECMSTGNSVFCSVRGSLPLTREIPDCVV